jgi:transcription initiation factor TFIIIB Brf1 subunit/transcription initiation factor TFIIB
MASKLKKEKTKQTRLAKAAGVSEVTLRNREKDLIQKINLARI